MSQDYRQLLQQFETKLREDIPLVNHMGFQQLEYNRDSLTIRAALEPNHNDKGTAFAGSLSACGNLCGWGLITLLLEQQDKDYDVVIRDSRLEYFLPVTQDFTLLAEFAAGSDQDAFIDKLKLKGKARMDVVIQVIERGELCFRLTGAYVALERKQWV